MINDITLISGHEYTVRDLFSGDTKIVIPDLQRDYCWGDKAMVAKEKKTRELVTGFVSNLLELYETSDKSPLTMGLIYGYEQPRHYIQICDGQQRLTTIFLLIGCINARLGNGKFNDYLISSREREDDSEPHLQYSIRESTLYFLSDLASKVFIDRSTPINEIRKANWYFNEYDQDASIQSMIAAIEKIMAVLDGSELDLCRFGDFILDNLKLLYYDMENRSRGEETYVIINTTGEPLSPTENIKPILLGKPSLSPAESELYSNQWEDREEWFWKHRGEDTTSDEGMKQFFMWYWQIGLIQEKTKIGGKPFPLNTRDLFVNPPKTRGVQPDDESPSLENWEKFQGLDNLNKYFNALRELITWCTGSAEAKKVLLSINFDKRNDKRPKALTDESSIWTWMRNAELHIVLPLITFLAEHKNPDEDVLLHLLRRLRKNHFDGEWSQDSQKETSRRGKNFVDWRYIIQIISKTSTDKLFITNISDIEHKTISHIPNGIWYGEDEKIKEALTAAGHGKDIIVWEDNRYLMGDLTPLWSLLNENSRTYDALFPVWERFSRMCSCFEYENLKKDDYDYCNWFRLFRLMAGLKGFGHVPNMTYDIVGSNYNDPFKDPFWAETSSIQMLLTSEDVLCTMKNYIRNKASDFLREPQSHTDLAKGWLILKTLIASEKGDCLSTYSDRAFAVYKEMKSNFIDSSIEEFHWGNVMCGLAWSYGSLPTRYEECWKDPLCLDSPLWELRFISNYYDSNDRSISKDQLEKADGEILKRIEEFLIPAPSGCPSPSNSDTQSTPQRPGGLL